MTDAEIIPLNPYAFWSAEELAGAIRCKQERMEVLHKQVEQMVAILALHGWPEEKL